MKEKSSNKEKRNLSNRNALHECEKKLVGHCGFVHAIISSNVLITTKNSFSMQLGEYKPQPKIITTNNL